MAWWPAAWTLFVLLAGEFCYWDLAAPCQIPFPVLVRQARGGAGSLRANPIMQLLDASRGRGWPGRERELD